MRRVLVVFTLAGALLSAVMLIADQKVYVAPKVYHANTYPARDEHPMEHVSIAVDPYDMADKTAGVLHVPYKEAGFLPIRLVVSNDGDSVVVLSDMKVELVTVKKVKIQPAAPEDIYRRISKQGKRPDESRPLPLPIPRKAKPSARRRRTRSRTLVSSPARSIPTAPRPASSTSTLAASPIPWPAPISTSPACSTARDRN
jgi:hypothetical protein